MKAKQVLKKLDYLPRWAWYMLSFFVAGPFGPVGVYLVFHVLGKMAQDQAEEERESGYAHRAGAYGSADAYEDEECIVSSDEEINRIVDFIGEHSNVQFDEKLTRRLEKIKEADPAAALEDEDEGEEAPAPPAAEPMAAPTANGIPAPAGMTQSKEDAIYRRALEVIRDTKRASISHFQRRMGIGYNHAARIVDLLEERGVISATRGAGPREIIQDPEALLAQMDGAEVPSADVPQAAEGTPAPLDGGAGETAPDASDALTQITENVSRRG